MFSELKRVLQSHFNEMVKDETTLFYVDINRDKIFEVYLDGYAPENRQEHVCNCCKSFLRQFGGIVVIKDNIKKTIWDIDTDLIDAKYVKSIKALKDYVHSLPITDIFLNTFKGLGTNRNYDIKNPKVEWHHFYLELPAKFLFKSSASVESVQGEKRDNKNVLKRSLDEITDDAVETVLELIAQGSLYKGNEFKGILDEFNKLKKAYKKVPNDLKDNFCWKKSTEVSQALTRIRNSAIGTLLNDLSLGTELDSAVSSFERVVAPTNYKRPTALITPKMVKAAEEKLTELGFLESLERRYATKEDINVENVLFVDRSSEIKTIFEEMASDVKVNPKSLAKIEEVSIEDFIEKVLPKSKSVEILLENTHLNNMVSIIGPVNKEAPTMFKWPNAFSWSYTGGITDSIKERVKAAGGKVEGELRVSLSWHNFDDLDLHVIEPRGNRIYFSSKYSPISGGNLDVDMNASHGTTRTPVENIIFPNESRMLEGKYEVVVNNFNARDTKDKGFEVEIEHDGKIFSVGRDRSPKTGEYDYICKIEYSKKDGIKIIGNGDFKTPSKEKWGVATNKYTKVKNIMLSPNYWNKLGTGNKHYFFILENCISDESPRPFFNEFLKEDLMKERKVFEVMGSKLKIADSKNQLSGIGFSDTQRNEMIVRINGTFKRDLKIKF